MSNDSGRLSIAGTKGFLRRYAVDWIEHEHLLEEIQETLAKLPGFLIHMFSTARDQFLEGG